MSGLRGRLRGHRSALVISTVILAAAVVLVALSLRREPPVTYAPTVPAAHPAGDTLVGPLRVTLDASDPDRWVYFDLSGGAVVDRPGPLGWDLAFRRFNIAVNGGEGFAGEAGVVALPDVAFEQVDSVPAGRYVGSVARRDSANPAIERWYDYGFTSHLLTPRPGTYAIRTAEGRYAKLRFLSYYCPGARPGCVTFEYVFQGSGGRRVR